jgi:hypothetical protein
MPWLFEFVAVVRQMTRDEFVQANPAPVLLRKHPVKSVDHDWTFKTQTMPPRTLPAAKLEGLEGVTIPDEMGQIEVLTVGKSLQNPWADRITVGRARNNDVVLADASVSKLHGHFSPQPDGQLSFVDLGSSNGSRINGRVLASGRPELLKTGDQLTVGALALTFLDAGSLYDRVTKLLANSNP